MPGADGFDSSYDRIPGVPLPARPEQAAILKRDAEIVAKARLERSIPGYGYSEGSGGVSTGAASGQIIVTNTSGPAADEPEIGEWHYEEAQAIFSSPLYVNVDVNDLIQDHGEEKAYEILGKLKDLLA